MVLESVASSRVAVSLLKQTLTLCRCLFEDTIREGRRNNLRHGRGGGTRTVAQARTRSVVMGRSFWRDVGFRLARRGYHLDWAYLGPGWNVWTKVGDEDVGHFSCDVSMGVRTPRVGLERRHLLPSLPSPSPPDHLQGPC